MLQEGNLDDKSSQKEKGRYRDLGMDDLDVEIEYQPTIGGRSHDFREIIREKLALVGLKNIEHMKPSELSGGMKKRVGLARAIAIEPEIILYDEPTTGLDPITSDAINDLMIHTQKALKVTSIAVTHDMVSAYKIADRIAMLYQGEIIYTGTPEEVKNTDNPYVRQFINGQSEGPIPT